MRIGSPTSSWLHTGGAAAPAHQSHSEQLPRYLWLPVEGFKARRGSLLESLEGALSFLSQHLMAGHRVLVHDAAGLDQSVCIAVALLLACYPPLEDTTATDGAQAGAGSGQFGSPVPFRIESGCVVTPRPVTKQSVRQRLAYVSSCYPGARPTQGMLKQVFNFFESRKPGVSERGHRTPGQNAEA